VARTLTDEQKQVVAAIRQFVEKEVRPAASALEHADRFPDELVALMKDLGLFGALIPEEFGGLGLTWATYAPIIEEISRGWASLALLLENHVTAALIVAGHGTDEQKRRLLPRLAAGDPIAGLCLFEPNAGEDLEAIQTTARREGNRYVISGTKTLVTNGRRGACFLLLARTGQAGEGTSCFIVERDGPGLRVADPIQMLGHRGTDTVLLSFEDFSISADNLVGGVEGRGLAQVNAALDAGLIQTAARAVGLSRAAFDDAIRYSQLRHTFGQPIAQHQAIQIKLADMGTALTASRLLTSRAAEKKDSGEPCDLEAGIAGLFASESAQEIAMESMRIHGGYGYIKEYPVERYYRDAPFLRIADGGSEARRLAIARQLLERYGGRRGALRSFDGEPPERGKLLHTIRTFVERDIIPAAAKCDLSDDYPMEIVERLKELGLFGAVIPKEYGGLGLDSTTYAMIVEEICRGWMSVSGVLNTHLIMASIVFRFGTEEQKRRFLPAMARGDKRGGLALTEASAGSDVQAISTVARREGDHYVVNGSKMFITNARHGNTFALLAKTDPNAAPPHKGMSCFIVEKGAPGFIVGRDLDKLGYRGLDTCEIHFEDFSVPKENLVGGKEGEGFKQVMAGLEVGRINIAARGVGVAQAAFEAALDYLRERPAAGRPMVHDPAILLKLAGIATTLEAARALTCWAAEKKDSGERCDLEAGMAKLFASEASYTVSLEAMSILGGDGYTTGCIVERCYRDAPLLIIGEGTNEIQRLLIARQLLKAHPV
jgi:alkylation response protein AidB-like acyl-CoA dehydrogenase